NHFKLVLLWGGFSEHGGQSVFCTDLIRSKSWPAGQDFVNSLKRAMPVFFRAGMAIKTFRRQN
ncbi:hypothetical protein RBA70_14165, partial [Brenneria goodwinii]